MDSLDRVVDTQPALEGAPQDAFKEACVPLNSGIPTRESLDVEGVVVEASLKVVVAPLFSTRLAGIGPRMPRMPNWLVLSSYIPPQN